MYGTGLKFAKDGRYYVTPTGDRLHVDRYCQYPYHYGGIEWYDSTNTLPFRIKRQRIDKGPGLRGPNGLYIVFNCWNCTVDHAEIEEMKVNRLMQRA